MVISKHDIINVKNNINNHIVKTPVLSFELINKICNCEVFFKCENFQSSGSFKYRAALNAIKNLPIKFKKTGIITHSSGNFAHALAKAAYDLKIPCYIVMPLNTDNFKKHSVYAYTKNIFMCDSNLLSRQTTTKTIAKKNNLYFIHPSNNLDVILGNSTCALELLNDYSDLQYIFSPIGGGGLIAGTSLAAKNFFKSCNIIGVEPQNVDDAYRSIKSGKIETNLTTNTIADGLRTNLGSINFPIIQEFVEEILLVTENEILSSLKLIIEKLKIVVEPSSAVVLAALIKNKKRFRNKKIGLIMCGGNVDIQSLKF